MVGLVIFDYLCEFLVYKVNPLCKRLLGFGNDTFGMILVVGGHQCLLAMDSYGSKISGLEMLDGKKVNRNVTTKKISVFPVDKNVNLEIRVSPKSVVVLADDKSIINWQGDPSKFSLNNNWMVPNKKWLHVCSYLSVFETSKLTLEASDE